MPARTEPRPSTEPASASLAVIACSGCQAGRSSADRWTAAAIASHGSSGETGASEPRASSHAVVEHPPQREAAVGAVGPDQLGHVAVVEKVRGLHAGDHADASHLGDVGAGHQLRVLDRTAGARLRVRRHGVVAGRVTDGVHGGPQPVLGRPRHQRAQLGRRLVGGAVAGPVGVRVLAPGRPGVEGAVADDLQRTHRQQVLALDQRVAGPQTGVDDGVETVGVDAAPDPEQVHALRQPGRPGVERLAVLELDDAHHAARHGVALHPQVGVDGHLVPADLGDPGVDGVPLGLHDHAIARGQPELRERAGVQPAVVGVAADEHDGYIGGDARRGRRRSAAPAR